ncbi:hypothetical protein MBLNU459_g3774t1 [Dothideomycetes sp. NU459]
MDASMDDVQYNGYIEEMRSVEYPMLSGATYLDHAGTTLYSKSLIDRFSLDMMSNLYGNPHSASQSSQRSTQQVEDVRHQLLQFFKADPDNFDLIFVANATAGNKLIADAFREHEQGFWYGYHRDAHTSLVGVRELSRGHQCFGSDEEVEQWLREHMGNTSGDRLGLFAYPAQSNMNGRKLPVSWCKRARQLDDAQAGRLFTLLDAAALVSTSPLDLSDVEGAPDFTVLSLYKIFGFPDLGALIVRKDAGSILQKRKYFGGGTVDLVLSLREQWHAKKTGALHEQLEDGTLPIHSILALKAAIPVHHSLYGSLERISQHTSFLAKRLYDSLRSLKHGNDEAVCQIYKDPVSTYGDKESQGPVVAFNLRDSSGAWVSNAEVEKLAHIKNINIRTGSLCNPGGTASSLKLEPWEMRDNFSAGLRCGSDNDIMSGKPTGIIRVSLGAMSTIGDIETLVSFVEEFFVDMTTVLDRTPSPVLVADPTTTRFHVESLTVYPIKSCAGWQIPHGSPWEVRPEGLAWDREWCIVHQGTGAALSQKKYPRMALIRPSLDFKAGVLRIGTVCERLGTKTEVTVPLSKDPRCFIPGDLGKTQQTNVCGDVIDAKAYTSPDIASFLSAAIGVPCQLARFPAPSPSASSTRHSKAHLERRSIDGSIHPILFSNESPILTISRSSLNRLNEAIKARSGKAASPSAFRANIILAESPFLPPGHEQPYAEDYWTHMRIGSESFEILGGCRRCQMVCVDQLTAEKNQEPFVTLAKTRRFAGKVLFGVHTCHLPSVGRTKCPTICAGDAVRTFVDGYDMRDVHGDSV